MSELVIQHHDFENAKIEIKKFSEQTTTDLDLKRVDDSKGVGEFLGDWFFGRGIGLDHKVTGEELNELTSQIQTHLHSLNNTQIKLIREFGQVYSALEALDKDYIQAILVSINATEETSQSIQETQEQIKKIVENQRKTLEELKKFKQKLDNYSHLGDIDKLWNDCQRWHTEISALSNSINQAISVNQANAKNIDNLKSALHDADEKIIELGTCLSQQISKFDSILAFSSELQKMVHLYDIDEIWTKTDIHTNKLISLTQQIDNTLIIVHNNQNAIAELAEYRERLCEIAHLKDVDELWNSNAEHSDQLIDLQKQSEETNDLIQHNKDIVDSAMVAMAEKNDTAIRSLTKRIKYAYLIAGGSLGLALIELGILLLKVI